MKPHRARAAVVIFEGNASRDERRKNLPPRFLTELHRNISRVVSRVDDIELFRARIDRNDFIVESDARRILRTTPDELADQLDAVTFSLFAMQFEIVIVIGGDTLDLEETILLETIERLRSSADTAVIGPSPDGGFYLLGLNALPSFEWRSIPLCTSDAREGLRAALERDGFTTAVAVCRPDIDSLADALTHLSPHIGLHRRLFALIGSSRGQTPPLSPAATPPGPLSKSPAGLRAPPRLSC